MILGLSSGDGGMTVGLWRLSSLNSRRPPWYRPQVTGVDCVFSGHPARAVPGLHTYLCNERMSGRSECVPCLGMNGKLYFVWIGFGEWSLCVYIYNLKFLEIVSWYWCLRLCQLRMCGVVPTWEQNKHVEVVLCTYRNAIGTSLPYISPLPHSPPSTSPSSPTCNRPFLPHHPPKPPELRLAPSHVQTLCENITKFEGELKAVSMTISKINLQVVKGFSLYAMPPALFFFFIAEYLSLKDWIVCVCVCVNRNSCCQGRPEWWRVEYLFESGWVSAEELGMVYVVCVHTDEMVQFV